MIHLTDASMEFQFGDKLAVLLESGSTFIHHLESCDSVIFCEIVKQGLHKFLETLHKLTYTMINNLFQISSLSRFK